MRPMTFSTDLSTIPTNSRRTKRSAAANENQNYGTALLEHQRQISRQTFNRGSTSTGDNINVFSDMTNAGVNVLDHQLIRPEPIQMKKLGKSQGAHKKTRNVKVQKAASTNKFMNMTKSCRNKLLFA